MPKSAVVARKKSKKSRPSDVFPPFPHRYVPDGLDAGSPKALEPLFAELSSRELGSPAALVRWLEDWSELAAVLAEEESRRYIANTCKTGDPVIEKAYLDFQNEVAPFTKPRWQKLKEKFAACPHRAKLDKKRYAVFNRVTETEVALFRPENVALETEDAGLVVEWQRLSGSMTVTLDGKELTLPQVARVLEETDRSRRETAWRALTARRLRDAVAIDAVYEKMVKVRTQRALNAGFKNYRDYAFREKCRFDYGPADCAKYHDAVEELVVPLLRRLHAERRAKLGVDVLRPWDLNVDPDGHAPLRPFATGKQLFEGVRDIYAKVKPDFARLLSAIWDGGNMDLESRKGKAPGGYQCTLDDRRIPFIFMNAAGVHRDVMTMLHEGGHALHAIFARKDPLLMYRSAPTEFCEVASMGMEAIGLKHLDRFYSAEETARATRSFFEDILKILPWIATIDAFQHRVYLAPDATAAERRAMWLEVRSRFRGGEDWSGLDAEHATSWHAQMHPFCVPFYYIEYAIAQIGALQVWLNARKDRRRAVRLYQEALSLGGSRPLPQLFKAAGARFGLDAKTLRPLVRAIEAELD